MKITIFKTPDIAFLAWLTQLWLLAHMPNHPLVIWKMIYPSVTTLHLLLAGSKHFSCAL